MGDGGKATIAGVTGLFFTGAATRGKTRLEGFLTNVVAFCGTGTGFAGAADLPHCGLALATTNGRVVVLLLAVELAAAL